MTAVGISNADLFVWALFRLGGASQFVDVEDVYVAAFELAPARFSWRTRQDLPDLKKCAKALRDAEARRPELLAKSSDRYCRQLTPEGSNWIRQNREWLENELDEGGLSFASSGRQKTSDMRAVEREKTRLITAAAYEKALDGKAGSISPREAEAFFRLNDYITGSTRAAKIQRILNMFEGDDELSRAVLIVAERVPRGK